MGNIGTTDTGILDGVGNIGTFVRLLVESLQATGGATFPNRTPLAAFSAIPSPRNLDAHHGEGFRIQNSIRQVRKPLCGVILPD